MKFVIGVMVLIVGIFIIGGLGAMADGVKDYRTDWIADSFVLTTNATTVNGTVQLTRPLWEGLTSEAVIASNITDDTPAMTSYTAGSRSLYLTGLAGNTSRLITVDYRTFALNDYPAADTGTKFIPAAYMLAAIFLPLLAVAMILLGR